MRYKGGSITNIVKTEKITDNLFLEFGKRKNEEYRYISLMQGNYRNPKEAKQLFFAHSIKGIWYVFDNDAINFVKEVGTKERAIKLLREIAQKLQ